MLKKMQSIVNGGVLCGLVLALLLFFKVPAQAEFIRGNERENLEAIFQYTMEITGEYAWQHAMSPINYLEGLTYGDAAKFVFTPEPELLSSIWARLNEGFDGGKYIGFAISLESPTSDAADLADFLNRLSINGTSVILPDDDPDASNLNFFYGPEFAEILLAHQKLEFTFGNQALHLGSPILEYTFTFYGITEAQVPEPATLAMLGCGLAGLGAIRARRKK